MSTQENTKITIDIERKLQLELTSEYLNEEIKLTTIDELVMIDEHISRLESETVYIEGHGPSIFFNYKQSPCMTFYITDGLLNIHIDLSVIYGKSVIKDLLRNSMKKHHNLKKINYFCFPNGKEEC